MQVLCKTSSDVAEAHCSVCGQAFTVVWERPSKMERANALREIAKTLRSHHWNQAGPEAHPDHGFAIDTEHSVASPSPTASFGHVPRWAL